MKKDNGLKVIRFSPEEAERRRLLQGALGYLLPAPQAEEAAGALLERFGGFEGVFLAPEEELAALLGSANSYRRTRGARLSVSRVSSASVMPRSRRVLRNVSK